MNKFILIALLAIFGISAVFLFLILSKEAKNCGSFGETECRANLVCKPFYEYGLSCGKDGCKEGERFKECTPRF